MVKQGFDIVSMHCPQQPNYKLEGHSEALIHMAATKVFEF